MSRTRWPTRRRRSESDDKAAMDRARETLTTASHKLAEQMYKAAQPQAAPRSRPGRGSGTGRRRNASQKKDEGVIDAEYVDVEEKK